MRIFIVPSWCPTEGNPIYGSFFIEQAQIMAKLRPHWQIGFVWHDLSASRVPWRLAQLPKFIKNFFAKSAMRLENSDNLCFYHVFKPHFHQIHPQKKLIAPINALLAQCEPAFADFIAKNNGCDAIIAHASYPALSVVNILAQKYKIKSMVIEHFGPFPPKILRNSDNTCHDILQKAYAQVGTAAAVSKFTADIIMNLGLKSQAFVIPNFLDTNFGLPITPPANTDKLQLLSICNPSHQKGTDLLLNALKLCDDSVHCQIIGDSAELNHFQNMAHQLNIGHRVEFLGRKSRHEITAYLQNAHIFILPSRYESFGVVFLEAIASGRAVIALNQGGAKDIITAQVGCLIDGEDIHAIALAIKQLRARKINPDFIRKYYEANFHPEIILQKLENILTSA